MKVVTAAGTISLGTVETRPTIGIIDYSRRVTDEFGVTAVVQRNFARRFSVRLALPFDQVDAVQQQLADLRATEAQWIADDRFAWLNVTGFYRDFQLDLAVPPVSYCTLTVEGLTDTAPAPDGGGDPAPAGGASTLRLLQPVELTTAMLTASSVQESEHPEWSGATTYAAGARVIKATTHRIYESLGNGNVGHDPAALTGHWLDVGPTNRWAMFDQALGTLTQAAGAIEVTINAAGANALALLDVTGTLIRVTASGYDRALAAGAGAATFMDLPPGPVTIRITGPGTVAVGTLLIGRMVLLGQTEASPTAGINDFSRKEFDEFGEPVIVPRAWAKRMSAKALIRTDAIDQVADRIAAVRARPSLWIGDEDLDSLTIYGFFKDFSIEVGENVSTLSLSIEGLAEAAPIVSIPDLITPPNWTDIVDNDPTRPKPADGATVGTPIDAPIGDRLAGEVLANLDIDTKALISQMLREEDAQRIFDARTFVQGQPVSTEFLSFRTDQRGVNEATAAQFGLLGAKTPDGTGWVLNMDAVKISPDESLAQRFSEIGVTNGKLTASVEFLQEAVIGPEGSEARAVLSVNANGVISGITLTSDGTTSGVFIAADEFGLVDPNAGMPFFPIYYSDGRWVMNADLHVTGVLTVGTSDILPGTITVPYFVEAGDVYCPVGTQTQVLITPEPVEVGDAQDGGALIMFFGSIDSGNQSDLGLIYRVFVDSGSGFVQVTDNEGGMRTVGANTRFDLPIPVAHCIGGVAFINIRVTAQPYVVADGNDTRPAYARKSKLVVFGGKR